MGIDLLSTLFSLSMGVGLGGLYFGGLWWTLKGIHQKNRPFGFIAISYLARTGICLVGFWLVLRHGIAALILSLIVFTLVRFILTRKIGTIKNVHQS